MPTATQASAPPPAAAAIPTIPAAPTVSTTVTDSAAASPRTPSTSGDRASGSALRAESETPRSSGASDGPTRIVLGATADSWIQIRDADHSVLFTGVLKPGETYRVPDRPGLSMRTGNAGGLNVTVDGKPLPSLGPIGTVRNVALDPQLLAANSTIHN
jgi:cytoskeleton protein RodZ